MSALFLVALGFVGGVLVGKNYGDKIWMTIGGLVTAAAGAGGTIMSYWEAFKGLL